MSIFQRIGKALAKFFGSSGVQAVEKAAAVEAAPVVEAALVGAAHANPIAEVAVVEVVNPVIEGAVAKMEEPPASMK